jgi:glycosyltransferase involved in cell wall biosynthesis
MKKKLVNKKIVIDARMINDSGIGTYLKNIIPFLFDEFDITLLGKKSDLLKIFSNYKFEFINFEVPIYSIKEQLFFPLLIPNCDIFWSPHVNSPILPISAKRRICTIHDTNHLVFDSGMNRVKRFYAKILYLNSVKRSNKIITVSNFSKQEIANIFPYGEKKINVIYCGVAEIFFKGTYPISNFKLPNKYILFVGNIKPHKNLITLLKAYQYLPQKFKNKYKILILGKKEGFITPDK